MKQTFDSPWTALVLGVALTAALYALALHLAHAGS
jgi:hypothetical protein